MFSTFLRHQWIAFWRSRNKGGTIAAQVLMGFLVLYLIGVCIFTGILLDDLMEKFMPAKDIYFTYNALIVYYFGLDFIFRLQVQELPAMEVKPYLHLKIARNKLAGFLHTRSLLSPINIFPLLIFTPFCITNIIEEYSAVVGAMYFIAILSLVVFNNFTALYVKRKSAENIRLIVPAAAVFGLLAALEYLKYVSVASLSDTVFSYIASVPLAGMVFPVLTYTAYTVNDRYLKNNLYLEELSAAQIRKKPSDYQFLNWFGEAGMLAALELKLIIRNKRPRATVTKGLILLIYGFIFYKEELLLDNQFGKLIFPAVFMTGNTILIYGQMMFGWQGAEFDGLLANRISIEAFFKGKYILLILSSFILTLAISLYGFISWKILVLQVACCLYNTGVSTFIMLYFATRNYKFVNISQTARLNWQGVSATTMLMTLPFVIAPYLVYLPLSLISPWFGLAGMTALGLTGLLSYNYWIRILVREFNNRKHKIAAGFREK